jgi:hypothetical protein
MDLGRSNDANIGDQQNLPDREIIAEKGLYFGYSLRFTYITAPDQANT